VAKKRWLRTLLHLVALALTVVVLAALVRAFRRDGPAALEAWRTADLNPVWLSIAVFAALAAHAVFVVGWKRLLVDCGIPISFWHTARLFLASNLGRYLPAGKAWQVSIIAVMAAEQQLPATVVAATSLLQGLVGLIVGALLLMITGSTLAGIAPVWLLIPLVGLIALLSLPALLRRLPSLRSAVVRRIPSVDAISARTMWTLTWTAGANWIAWGCALYALARGLLGDSGASVLSYIAAWTGSFLAGLLAFVTPAGLGVRDEVMRTMLMSAGLSAAGAIILVVVARVWTTLLDVGPALIVLAIRRRRKAVSSHLAVRPDNDGGVSPAV
jgi:uncharacterized membrane protein YbhN (UPF0104 family)